ncbi:MAG: gamma carbonic anhydrase family protein [Rhodospirillaceae bacterium]
MEFHSEKPRLLPWKGVMPSVADDAFVAPSVTIIGDTEIGSMASIWFNVVLRGDVNFIRIGARTNIQDGTIVHVASQGPPTIIGQGVVVGHLAMIHACNLDDGCFIGMSAVVMDGAVVETGAMVAAGALVPPGKRVGAGQLWAGTPAKYVRDTTEEERSSFSTQIQRYVDLGQTYRGLTAER